ncbi:putative phage abortive infection protein [Patiriisocius sp. Uisw_017]|uniref:putative phage abortive infection protein n=1 Tax=Patiriisocius sp. Uisw_017 TaxID=3230968 RepID=UPI0039EB5F5F
MNEINLEQEIRDASNRIQARQSEIESELTTLESKIKNYTNWAWGFVWTGIGLSVFSVIFYLCKNTDKGFGLNLLGDFLGGSVASVWALAGLFLIYVAFLGQKQQLLNQQLEIMYSQLEVKYTRLELAGQKEEMILQNQTLLNQKFENTFFQLLTLFNNIIDSLDLRRKDNNTIIATGRDCFDKFNTSLNHATRNIIGENRSLAESTIEEAVRAYDTVYDKNKSDLSHYFRTIYHIFKFIDDSKIDNKKRYASIARAQLSSYEQILLFYNCQHVNGLKKFKPLIEKFAVFKNIDESLILSPNHFNAYEPSARGNN